jgi:hypothetical protein
MLRTLAAANIHIDFDSVSVLKSDKWVIIDLEMAQKDGVHTPYVIDMAAYVPEH